MFVDIDDFKSPLAVENILTPYKKGRLSPDKKTRLPREKITPDICMEILHSTNYARNIKDMLECIWKLPKTEQAQFKDVVLATFTQREQPQTFWDLGQEFAIANKFESEFEEMRKIKDGEFLSFSAQKVKCYISLEKFFAEQDFSVYDKLICLSDEIIKFAQNVKFPKQMEFPNSSEVWLQKCDFSRVESVRFKEGAKVKLGETTNLPTQLDVSMCGCVHLEGCDLSEYSQLLFKDGAEVWLSVARSFPQNLDVSMCSYVNFAWCELKEQTQLRFKDGAKVSFWWARSLPDNLDVSNCAEVTLVGCKLSHLSELKFMHGASVDLGKARSLPQHLDVSMCQEVDLSQANLAGVETLIFKNRQQMTESSVELPNNWEGKLVFTDEMASSQIKQRLGKFIGKMLGKDY